MAIFDAATKKKIEDYNKVRKIVKSLQAKKDILNTKKDMVMAELDAKKLEQDQLEADLIALIGPLG